MKNFIPAILVLAALAFFAPPASAAIIVLDGKDVMLLDDSGAWHNVGPSRDYYSEYARPSKRGYGSYEPVEPVYNYNNTGDPAAYNGAPYQNFRGYDNVGGYANSYYGYISRPGYLGGYYY